MIFKLLVSGVLAFLFFMNEILLNNARSITFVFALSFAAVFARVADAGANDPLTPLLRAVDMDKGETARVELHDGSTAEVEVLAVETINDSVFDAVREVNVTVRVNGIKKTIRSGNYNLPVRVGNVQIDCPVTADYMKRAHVDWWGLEKDVRLRLWPAGSPYAWPGTFVYPVSQKWLASFTHYSNEPVVDDSRPDKNKKIYYHAGIDLGGAEDMVEVYAATDGIVVSVRGEVLKDDPDNPISPRYDVVYIRDDHGWYYRYSHFALIIPELQLGQRVRAGKKLGMLGKEGGSGGWTHLHFEIKSKQPSGKWGTQDSYAFLWEAYRRQYDPDILAVARPYKVVYKGETTTLSARNSWAKTEIVGYEWKLSDGSTKSGMEIEIRYDQPGTYSEIVKVTDLKGNHDYDFAVVKVYEGTKGEEVLPDIHATFYPTMDISAGEKVFFQVRSRWITEGYDVWDFRDGSDPVTVKSNIETGHHAKVGYSIVSHRFAKPGDYLVKVQRKSSRSTATAHVYVRVLPSEK
jgi:murein DD-endopeptidase MepM/ murein hydrolase activator NlpD